MSTILKLNGKNYCAFCGKLIIPTKEGQLNCQCKDAQEYRKALTLKMQLEMEASKVMLNAPKPKFGLNLSITPIKDCTAYTEDDFEAPSNPL